MIEYKVSGTLNTGEPFTFFVKAYDTWHAMNKTKLMMIGGVNIKAMSAFKV